MHTNHSPRCLAFAGICLLFTFLAIRPATAGEYRVLIDADDDATTGCSVTIAGSTFDGAEQIVITTVDDGTDQVTAVARQECTDPGTDTFGAPITLSDFPTPWPVGVALGTMGSDVVETYFPLSALGGESVSMRLGYASDDLLGNQDVMFNSTGGSGGDPIVLSLGPAPLEIPTVGPVGLLFLSLLLAGAAAWVLRDADRFASGGTVAAVLLMVVLAPVALAVADILLDGDPSDWVGGIDAQGTDPAGDVPGSADILAGYAAVSTDGTILYLRLDVTREAQPEAEDDAFTVTEDDPQTTFDVLANDTDLDGGLKEVVSVTQPANGTVAITNAGADVGYTPDADYCNDGTPTDDFTYTVNGGSSATVSVAVTCVNDAPVKTAGGGGPATFVEGGGPVVLDPGITVSDVDDTNLESATVSITNLLDGADEVLAADTTGTAIVAAYNSGTGVLSLTGSDTVANYQQVLRSVTYDNTSADPDPIDRGLTCVANDGDVDSNVLNMSVTVGAVNTAPTKTAGGGGPVSFTEDGGPVAIDPGVTVSDPDDVNLESATITLTNPLDGAAEVLAASTGGTGITAVYDSGTGVLSLTGTETLAVYETVLQSITYENTSDDPSLADRSIDCLVNDGSDDSNTLTATVEITAVNDAPVKTAGGGGPAAFTEDAGPVAVDPGVTVTDADDTNLESATVTITNLLDAGDEILAAAPSGAIAAGDISYAAPNLTIAPAGGAPLADFQAVLQSVTYENASDAPDETDRTLSCVVNDGDADSNVLSPVVTVTAVNDAPTKTSTLASPNTFTEGDPPTVIDNTIAVSDPDDTNLESATVTITNLLDPTFELLDADTAGTSIAASYTAPTLTLSGTDTVANYQQVLRTVTYENTDEDPDGTDRAITCVVNDGDVDSTTLNATMEVVPVNDPPAVTSPISYAAIGNTLLRVLDGAGDGHDTPLPGRVASSADGTNAFAKANPTDVDSAGTPAFVAGTYATTAAPGDGSLTIDDDGDFYYTPPTGFTGGTDTVAVNVADGDGGLTPVTFELTVSDMVWYVEDTTGAKNPVGNTDGRSTDAFETLAAAEAASGTGDIILVMETDLPHDGITLKSGQKLYGQRVEEETTSLMPAGFIWEEISDTNSRPQIHPGAGAAVTVDATAGALTNVEIRHLDLQSVDDDAIAVTTGGTNVASVLVDENVIGAAGADGVDVNSGHTSGKATVILTDNTITSTLDGVNVSVDAGGDVDLAIDRLTDVTAGFDGIELRSPGVGTLTVTSFTANSIHQDTGGNGFVADDVTFDDGGGSVSATTFVVGDPADGVGLGGVLLGTVRGGLIFTDLDVHADGGTGVRVANPSLAVGDFTFGTGAGSTVDAAGGPALDLDPMTAAVTLDNLVSTGSGTQGVRLVDVAGSVNVVAGSISGTTGDAFLVDRGTAMVDYDGTIANTSARSVAVTGRPAGAGNVTFGGNIGSSITQNSGTGILVDSNAAGIVAFDGGVFLSTATAPAVTLTSNGAAVVNFNAGVDLDTSSGNGFVATGGGTVNVLSGAVSTTVNTTTGTAVEIAGTDIGPSGVTFDSVGTSGGPNGILLTSVPSGNFTASGGSIVNATNRGLDVSGGAGNVTVNASISTTANGRSVEVTGKMGGTVAVGGAVDDNGLGVNLDSNSGSTVNLSGGLDIDTAVAATEPGFEATGGGTVNVTGTNTVNTTAGTNIGVRITNTDIGASDVTFQSIDVNGAANGIVLDTTGTSGGLAVTGDGSTAGSGGTIQNTTSDAVRLITSDDASLRFMNISGSGANGIFGTDVEDFDLRHTTLTNNGDAVDEGGIRFADTNTVTPTRNGLLGTARFDNVTVDYPAAGGFGEHHVEIINISSSLALTVIDSTFRNTANSGLGADGFQMEMRSSATATLDVSGSSFSGNATQGLQGAAIDSAALTANVTTSSFDDNNEGLVLSTSSGGDLIFDISGNTAFTNHDGVAIFVGTTSSATATSNVTGSITGNTNIQTPASGVNHSVVIFPSGDSKATILVDGNSITNDGFFRGINVTNTDNAGDLTDLDITITNNTVTNGANADHAILVEGRRDASVCAKIEGNTASAVSATKFGIRLRERDSSTVQLEQGSSASSDPATVLADNNPASVGFSVTGAPAVVANNTCDQVP